MAHRPDSLTNPTANPLTDHRETLSCEAFSHLLRERRSVRDFLPTPVAPELIACLLADAAQAPSWSNTQPYRLAVATGAKRDQLAQDLCANFDAGMAAVRQGWRGKLRAAIKRRGLPDGDLSTQLSYPAELQAKRRDTGHGLYDVLGIGRGDHAARERQIRRNFEFFGAPVVMFVFAHKALKEFAVLDAGIMLQTLMLSAQAHGLATCAQGALATWGGPVRAAFAVPPSYLLVCGLSLGYASADPINGYNPGRADVEGLCLRD